jgi:cytosine/uracil/thiamine/allantoin permease
MAIASNKSVNDATTPISTDRRAFGFHDHASLWFSLGVGLLVMQVGAYLMPALGTKEALIAIAAGSILGGVLSRWLMAQFQTELFTFPFITESSAYGRSALFVAAAVIGAALAVRRGVDRLDLVGVLKSRE